MRPTRSSTRSAAVAAIAAVAVIVLCVVSGRALDCRTVFPVRTDRDFGVNPHVKLRLINQGAGPSLRGGVGWINSGPIALAELRGKIVLLDFWTFCCINCHHVLPDLAKLEEKYKNELVVIGVHSRQVRRRARHREHPPQSRRVPDQASGGQRREHVIWNRFGVNSWPTLVLIDANGNYVDRGPAARDIMTARPGDRPARRGSTRPGAS